MPGGSSSPQTSTQTTTQNTGPPEYIRGALQGGIDNLVSLYNQNPNAPAYYPGTTVAPYSSQSTNAINSLYNMGTNGSPNLAAANGQVGKTIAGDYTDIANNPYFQSSLAAGFAPQTKQFMNTVLPGVQSQFEGAGRYGSGANVNAVGTALDSLNNSQANAAAVAAGNAYSTERGYQNAAVNQVPALQQAGYADINAAGSAGNALDTKSQQNIDADVAKYNYNQTAQQDYINRFLQSINAGYPGSSSSGTSTGTSTPASNSGSSIFGGAMGLAGLGLQAFSAFSDERLKDDITPVGKLHDGQTVYSYRYKGEPRTQIGLIAQEVEKFHPEAVSTHPSGYKMVNYARATGGLL